MLRFFKFITGRSSLYFFLQGRGCLEIAIVWVLLSPTFPELPVPIIKTALLTFLSSLVFSPEIGDLQTGFCTPLQ